MYCTILTTCTSSAGIAMIPQQACRLAYGLAIEEIRQAHTSSRLSDHMICYGGQELARRLLHPSASVTPEEEECAGTVRICRWASGTTPCRFRSDCRPSPRAENGMMDAARDSTDHQLDGLVGWWLFIAAHMALPGSLPDPGDKRLPPLGGRDV